MNTKIRSRRGVSIIVITKNRLAPLRRCITSILSQTTHFDECIIVDSSTDDKTQQFVLSLHDIKTSFRYIHEDTPGYAAARNRGVEECRNQWAAFTDDDCSLDHRWLEKMLHVRIIHPHAAAFIGQSKSANPRNSFSLAAQYFELCWKLPALKNKTIIDPEILDTKNIMYNSRAFHQHRLKFKQERQNGKLLTTDDIDMGMQLWKHGYRMFYEENAVVYHDDPTVASTFFHKLLFDRFSYKQFARRWKKERTRLQHIRKKIPSQEILQHVFAIYHTPWHLRIATRLIIIYSNLLITLNEHQKPAGAYEIR